MEAVAVIGIIVIIMLVFWGCLIVAHNWYDNWYDK